MATKPLKTLIVEDTPSKKKKLFEKLNGLPDVFLEPDVAVSTSEAIRRLQASQYDLLLLDVNVPFRPDEDPSEANSVELLTRLDAGVGGLHRPHHVLQFSSSETLPPHIEQFLRGRPWGCITYKEDSSQSLDHIERVGRWIVESSGLPRDASQCDVFVITALEAPEFTSLEIVFEQLDPLEPLDSTQLVRYCTLNVKGVQLKIGIAFAPRMGPVATAVLATKVVDKLRPKLILMTGICGAASKSADIGDVIAAETSWDWQSGKHVANGHSDFELAPHHLQIPAEFRSALIQLRRNSAFWGQFSKQAMELKLSLPKLLLGPMATGAAVIADERVVQKIKEEQHKNVTGIDMETYALYAAAASADYRVAALSMKAVSDRADREKNDMYQPYAALVSARCAFELLKEHGTDLIKYSNLP